MADTQDSKPPDNPPAFPQQPCPQCGSDHAAHTPEDYGMTLRDYYAAHALTGLLVTWRPGDELARAEMGAAISAYRLADAMLAERSRGAQS